MKIYKFILLTLLFLLKNAFAEDEKYLWPVKNDIGVISSSFGEFRRDHFHSGIDISTQGTKNVPAVAVSNASLWKIVVTPHGYGRKLILKLDDGKLVSYAHLKSYCKKINELVQDGQEELGKFSISFYPQPDAVRFEAGETVGIIGGSGGFKPHLHFEMIDENGNFINPLKNGFYYDTVFYPKIKKLVIVPLEKGASVNKKQRKALLQAWLDKNRDVFQVQDPIQISGAVGFEVETEFLSEVGNKIAPYKILLYIDDKLVFERKKERFMEEDYRLIYHEYDRELYLNEKGKFIRLYDPVPYSENKNLFVQGITHRKGRFSPGEHHLVIEIENYSGQKKRLEAKLIIHPEDSKKNKIENNEEMITVANEELLWKFDNDKFLVKFQVNSFKENKEIFYKKKFYKGNKEHLKPVTGIYTIIPEDLLSAKEFETYIKVPESYRGREKYLGIFQIEPQRIRFVDCERESLPGYIAASMRYPSRILVMEDARSPKISHVKPSHGSKLKTKKPVLRATIVDKGSKLNYRAMHMYLDGEEVPAEFNVTSGEFIYRMPEQLEKGKHSLKIIAEDNVGNKKTRKIEFWVK